MSYFQQCGSLLIPDRYICSIHNRKINWLNWAFITRFGLLYAHYLWYGLWKRKMYCHSFRVSTTIKMVYQICNHCSTPEKVMGLFLGELEASGGVLTYFEHAPIFWRFRWFYSWRKTVIKQTFVSQR